MVRHINISGCVDSQFRQSFPCHILSRMNLARATNSFTQVAPIQVSAAALKGASALDRRPRQDRELKEIERLKELLRGISDRSLLSPELLRQAIAQGLWYHITPLRSALIRSLDIPASSRILEVGCGAGALTRYLGECGYTVVALETSEELADCARLRCQDLRNVEVVTGFLEQVLPEARFDFVICVDPLLVESEFFDPGLQLFSMCQKALKATGTMILSVANPLHTPGAANVEPSSDHVRGKGAPLSALKSSLQSAGFEATQEFVTFPHHAAPRLIIDVNQARLDRVAWLPLLKDLYQATEAAEAELEGWWRGIFNERLETQLAPGWLVLAHAHQVHSIMWKGCGANYFVPVADIVTPPANDDSGSLRVEPMVLNGAELVAAVLDASKPVVNSVRDYKDSLIAADQKIDELAFRESIATENLKNTQDILERSETLHATEIKQERESRRIREAELSLVLKQYHSVGAMCHDMREEGRKLKVMLDELRRRYVASEEWGVAMSKRVAEAEHELEKARAWFPRRLAEKIGGLFSNSRSGATAKRRVTQA